MIQEGQGRFQEEDRYQEEETTTTTMKTTDIRRAS